MHSRKNRLFDFLIRCKEILTLFGKINALLRVYSEKYQLLNTLDGVYSSFDGMKVVNVYRTLGLFLLKSVPIGHWKRAVQVLKSKAYSPNRGSVSARTLTTLVELICSE